MCKAGSELCHLVHIVHAFARKEVQTVKVLLVVGEEQRLVRLLYAQHSLEDGALALLNPLSHGVQVGSEVA